LPARSRIRKVFARSALRPLSRKYSSVRKAETFSATATLMSWFRATLQFSSLAQLLNKEGCSRSAKITPSHGIKLLICCRAVDGRITAQLNPFIPDAKSRRLNVTIALAASVDCGFQNHVVMRIRIALAAIGKARRTGLATAVRSSRTRPTSTLLNPHRPDVAGGSGPLRIKYERNRQQQFKTADLRLPTKAGGKNLCRSATPQLSRPCRERKKPPRNDDIAGNITKSAFFRFSLAAVRIATIGRSVSATYGCFLFG